MFTSMNSPTRKVVAGEVRAAMARAGITQGELARRIGMSQPSLSERLSGRRSFTTDHIYEIGRALGIDPLSLLRPPTEASTEAAS